MGEGTYKWLTQGRRRTVSVNVSPPAFSQIYYLYYKINDEKRIRSKLSRVLIRKPEERYEESPLQLITIVENKRREEQVLFNFTWSSHQATETPVWVSSPR